MKKKPLDQELAKRLRRILLRKFGKPCKQMYTGCANCNAHSLIGYLNWYLD